MTATVRLTQQHDTLGIPWDLTEWIDQRRLLEWIDEEIATLDWNQPNLIAFLRANPAFRPKMWLRLMLYAYVTGIYGSDEIIACAYEREPFKTMCGELPPTSYELRAFRRENRGLLKAFLVQIFKRTLKEKFEQTLIPSGLRQRLIEAALLRIDLAREADHNAGET